MSGRFDPLDPALKCNGVARVADNDRMTTVAWSRPLTDAELRFFYDVCQRAAPLMLLASEAGDAKAG